MHSSATELEGDESVQRERLVEGAEGGGGASGSGNVQAEQQNLSPHQKQVLTWKDEGNELFRTGNCKSAIEKFTEAIKLDETNKVLFCNRSLCYASLEDWNRSIQDAKIAITLDPKYTKAHFRLIKAYLSLNAFRECRQHFMHAIKECGETPDLRQLEVELTKKSGIPPRPGPNNFDVIQELGSGNFSKIYKCSLKSTGKVYSLKVIEKQTVQRMKRRHGNINNEILMEKRVLNKLDHISIVTMFSTFQDFGTLYFQMEFVAGGEVWGKLFEGKFAVGCHWSIGRFIIAETVTALEYIHSKGVVHRDLKVENMMITEDGHLKLIDFGTSKDLIETDLNGPEFVGTPEYMSPQTLKSEQVGVEADLWSLGIVVFQIFAGYTPFGGASPYLTFLRIKNGLLARRPLATPPGLFDFLSLLLESDPTRRLANALGFKSSDGKVNVCYDALRAHSLFEPLANDISSTLEMSGALSSELPSNSLESVRKSVYYPAVRVPRLSELCIRAVGKAAIILTDQSAELGGIRPEIPWMQNFDLFHKNMDDSLRMRVAHYLHREQRLHVPPIYRLFHKSLIDARCLRSSVTTREYVGHCRELQGRWLSNFFFCFITDLMIGKSGEKIAPKNEYAEQEMVRKAVSIVNRIRPRFLVVNGNFIDEKSFANEPEMTAQSDAVRKVLSRVSETIPVLFVAGNSDVGSHPTPESLSLYQSKYGADYYGYWYGGVRCLVVNSPLMNHPEDALIEAAAQDLWFEEEIEQAKMCSTHMLIFSHHPWFINDKDDEEESTIDGVDNMAVPKNIRCKWLKILRHTKVKFLFVGRSSINSSILCHPSRDKKALESIRREGDNTSSSTKKSILSGVEPLKPSEIIARATLENSDLVIDDVTIDMTGDSQDGNAEDSSGKQRDQNNDHDEGDSDSNDEDDEEFVNENEEYSGPEMVTTSSISNKGEEAGIRIVRVYEENVTQEICSLESDIKEVIV